MKNKLILLGDNSIFDVTKEKQKKEIVNIKEYFEFYTSTVYSYIEEVVMFYPEFKNWYNTKVVNQLNIGNRQMLINIIRDNKGIDYISGVAILKNKEEEKKICTIKIFDDFKNKGIGKQMFEKSFELLENEKPLITISGNQVCEFEKIIKRYDLNLESVMPDYYKKGHNEYIYNGELK